MIMATWCIWRTGMWQTDYCKLAYGKLEKGKTASYHCKTQSKCGNERWLGKVLWTEIEWNIMIMARFTLLHSMLLQCSHSKKSHPSHCTLKFLIFFLLLQLFWNSVQQEPWKVQLHWDMNIQKALISSHPCFKLYTTEYIKQFMYG